MRNFTKPAQTITLTAPAGGVTAGSGYRIGRFFVVAVSTVAAGLPFEGQLYGQVELPKTSAQAWSEGDAIYWDATNSRCDSDPTKGQMIGVAAAAAANPTATGQVRLNAVACARALAVAQEGSPAATSKNTAGGVTLTAAEVLSGILVADPNGAGRTYTFPTAALLVAALPGAKVGDLIRLYVVNGADAAEVLTLAEGAGGGWDANQTASSRVIGQNTSKLVHIRLTNVTPAAEAYVMYA